jgi:alkylhydroperoxidase family enzyme
MPRIDVPEGMRPLSRLDELAPGLRTAMKELRRVTLDETILPFSEIEVIRLRCAQLNGCRTCFSYRMERDDPERAARAGGRLTPEFYAAVLGDGDPGVLTEREVLLRELCERFYLDHFSLDEDEPFWERVRSAFTDAELAEATITLMSFGMSARLNRVLGVDGVSENGDVCVVPLGPPRVEAHIA